jgi:hypothetical protein
LEPTRFLAVNEGLSGRNFQHCTIRATFAASFVALAQLGGAQAMRRTALGSKKAH